MKNAEWKRVIQHYALCIDPKWGVSSAGRAPALQAGGHRFDPGTLHQAIKNYELQITNA